MATWVTHLIIADGVLERIPGLDRRGFCVGNIAPDCNQENEDWTAFMPPREVTHWMGGSRKVAADCDRFYEEYIGKRRNEIECAEEMSFLLGYYSHLITDAAFQAMIRDEERVKAAWRRVKGNESLCRKCEGMAETWDSIKILISRRERMMEIDALEAKYLRSHPDSGYLTEILPLKEFPDYIDYLPKGGIVRKIGVMGYLPQMDGAVPEMISVSEKEYHDFVSKTVELVVERIRSGG